MRKIDTPCKDCDKKGCGAYHDQCNKYQEYRKQKDAIIKEKIENIKQHEITYNSIQEKRKKRWKKIQKGALLMYGNIQAYENLCNDAEKMRMFKNNILELKEVYVNLKNYDFEIHGNYNMDENEAKKIINYFEKLRKAVNNEDN